MTEPSVGNVNTEKYTRFYNLKITGDYSDYDVLEEENKPYKKMKFGSKLKK